MIQIYKRTNPNFDQNGDAVLFPSEAHTISEINGSWTASLTHPIDPEGRWRYIETDSVVKMPSHNGEQLYRITRTRLSFDEVEAEMTPIFFDSAGDCFLVDSRPTDKTGQEALDIMTAPNRKYSAWSDIDTKNTAYYQYKNLMEAISGDGDNSFLARWGGEIEYDNYTVKIYKQMGENRGFKLIEGKNIANGGFSRQYETDFVTRVYPVAFNGRKYRPLYIDFPAALVSHTVGVVVEFPNIVLQADAGTADYDDPTIQIAAGEAELDRLLLLATYEWMRQKSAAHNATAEQYEIDFVDVRAAQGFSGAGVESLEEVHLGDTVQIVVPSIMNYTPTRRISAIEYDSVNERISKITIGNISDYFAEMSKTVYRVESATTSSGTVKAENFAGALTGYVSLKGVHINPTSGVEVGRVGDMVSMKFNNKGIQQTASLIKQSWTLPEGFRPAETQHSFLPTVSGMATLILYKNGDVYFQPPNSNNNYYATSISYRTGDPMPEQV